MVIVVAQVVKMMLTLILLVGWALSILVNLGVLLVWILGILKSLGKTWWKPPVIYDIARMPGA